MKLEILENSKNYTCTVVEIKNLFPIEGADKIQRCNINGNDVVVSKDVNVGDKMLYFVSGTKLNKDYCSKNNLYDNKEFNENKEVRGFISYKQSRVKAIKLKGVISDGILMPLTSIFVLGVNYSFNVGDEFNSINGIILCEKYVVVDTQQQYNTQNNKKKEKGKLINRIIENQFRFHIDTSNLRKNIHDINPNDIIGIHKKKHGCSAIYSNILVKKQLKWYEKLAKKLGLNIIDTEYDIIYSSRRVIKNNNTGNSYYKTDIWGDVKKEIEHLIPKNWTIYGEILGFESDGKYIQKDYDYGCKQGEHKFYVYRITINNPDGNFIELTDMQIKEWCNKVGLLYSDTFIYYGKVIDLYRKLSENNLFSFGENWKEDLLHMLETEYNEKDCDMCVNRVPQEGVILRVEKIDDYVAYKLKSKRFLLKESELQEKEVLNIEDNG